MPARASPLRPQLPLRQQLCLCHMCLCQLYLWHVAPTRAATFGLFDEQQGNDACVPDADGSCAARMPSAALPRPLAPEQLRQFLQVAPPRLPSYPLAHKSLIAPRALRNAHARRARGICIHTCHDACPLRKPDTHRAPRHSGECCC